MGGGESNVITETFSVQNKAVLTALAGPQFGGKFVLRGIMYRADTNAVPVKIEVSIVRNNMEYVIDYMNPTPFVIGASTYYGYPATLFGRHAIIPMDRGKVKFTATILGAPANQIVNIMWTELWG
jgi:hypothetical protein